MSPCDGVHGGSPCVLAPVPGLRPAPGFSPSSRERYGPWDILLAGPGPRRGTVSLSKESSCEDVIRSHVCCDPSLLLLFRGETLSLRKRQHHRAQRSACPQLAGSVLNRVHVPGATERAELLTLHGRSLPWSSWSCGTAG